MKRAARIGDAWLIANATTLGRHRAADADLSRHVAASSASTVTEFPIARECYVGSSNATAIEECRAALEYKYNSYAAWGMESPTAGMTFEEMARDRFIIGDKVAVKEEIARWRERAGRQPLHHARAMAGAGAGEGAGLDPSAGRDLRMTAMAVGPHPP